MNTLFPGGVYDTWYVSSISGADILSAGTRDLAALLLLLLTQHPSCLNLPDFLMAPTPTTFLFGAGNRAHNLGHIKYMFYH